MEVLDELESEPARLPETPTSWSLVEKLLKGAVRLPLAVEAPHNTIEAIPEIVGRSEAVADDLPSPAADVAAR